MRGPKRSLPTADSETQHKPAHEAAISLDDAGARLVIPRAHAASYQQGQITLLASEKCLKHSEANPAENFDLTIRESPLVHMCWFNGKT